MLISSIQINYKSNIFWKTPLTTFFKTETQCFETT